MIRSKFPALAALSFAICLAATGCSKNTAKASAHAFDTASPDIKVDWFQAVAADLTNDYYTASIMYAKVLSQETNLTAQQFQTLEAASRSLSQRMVSAAGNGDDSAKRALARLMNDQNRH
jgi:hypothetical protein